MTSQNNYLYEIVHAHITGMKFTKYHRLALWTVRF